MQTSPNGGNKGLFPPQELFGQRGKSFYQKSACGIDNTYANSALKCGDCDGNWELRVFAVIVMLLWCEDNHVQITLHHWRSQWFSFGAVAHGAARRKSPMESRGKAPVRDMGDKVCQKPKQFADIAYKWLYDPNLKIPHNSPPDSSWLIRLMVGVVNSVIFVLIYFYF